MATLKYQGTTLLDCGRLYLLRGHSGEYMAAAGFVKEFITRRSTGLPNRLFETDSVPEL